MNIDYDLGVVIPARLGSSRVKDKVFVTIDGSETLLERKIRQLRSILPEDRVVVNTESQKIAEIALNAGASVHFRELGFAIGHEKTFSQLIQHVVAKLNFEHVAWTPFVVPFLGKEEFKSAFEIYKQKVIVSKKFDSLVSVVALREYVWHQNKPLNYEANEHHTISQDLPEWCRVTNGLYMAPKCVMKEKKYILGDRVYLSKNDSKCGVDIDTLFDVQIAKAFAKVLDEG